jgi:hypothetical protein
VSRGATALVAGLLAAAGVALVAGLLLPGESAERARPRAELSLIDDQLLLGARPQELDQAMRGFRSLGVDRIRVSAFWRDHAPAARSLRRPPGFRAEDARASGYRWAALDRVVRGAAANGLRVMITITPPAPLWATRRPRRRNPVYEPLPGEFAAYARAIAARYRSQADQYGLTNEPNQGGWLQPQSRDGELVAPHLYRELVTRAYPAVKRADPSSTVLVGELASSGVDERGDTRPIRPLQFLRAMACVDARARPLRSGPCASFRPVPLDALGHHPYEQLASPNERSRDPDDAAIGDTARLLAALDRLVAARRLRPSRPGRLDVHYTEFGYQTDPPDPFAGVSLRRQDRWLQDAAYVAWREPRVRQLNQFRLTDGKLGRGSGPAAYREFQSGLYFADFRPKPAARSFPHPFALARGAGVWGQVRPGSEHVVALEHRPAAGGAFRRIATVETDAQGYFLRRLDPEPGSYRFSYRAGERTVRSSPLRVR